MKYTLTLFLALALCATTLHAQQIYRWVDANGRTQYTDTPPPSGAKEVKMRSTTASSIQNNPSSLQTLDAQQKNPVTLYASECGEGCDAAKAYLNSRGVPHTLVDPTRTAELNKRFREETGGNVVPVLKVGERRLNGWSEQTWASALDGAGYPRTPSFGKANVVDAAAQQMAAEEAKKKAEAEAAPPAEGRAQ